MLSKDVSKWTMIVPQIMMEVTSTWPKRRNKCSFLGSMVLLLLLICLELGQLAYFILNLKDIDKMSSTMSTISTTFQAMTKVVIVVLNSGKLKQMIDMVEHEFWPSDILGQDLQKSLASLSRTVFFGMSSVFITGMIFGVGACSFPLIEGRREVPLLSWYPFDWSISPVYEIVYIYQFFTNCYVAILTICAHDNLFFVLVSNCIAQYRLLREIVKKIGTGQEKELNKSLLGFDGIKDFNSFDNLEEMKLLVKCIDHHNKLLRFSKDVQLVFSISLFVQLFASVTAICVSSFLLTVANIDTDQWYHLGSYCLGHVLQLFLFCAAGQELAYESKCLSSHAFESKWYFKKYTSVRRGLILMIQTSQRESRLSALGAVVLNYNTFISVLRVSFSLYTLMSNITAKH